MAQHITIHDYNTEIPGELSEDGLTWLFPQINGVNSHAKPTQWRIAVRAFVLNSFPTAQLPNVPMDKFIPIREFLSNAELNSAIRGWIKVESKIGDGVDRKSIPTIVHSGKNKGKKSSTNVICQALRDALSLHNKQLKKTEDAGGNVNAGVPRMPPMLAQTLREQKNFVLDFSEDAAPIYLQRKYNGVRTVTTRELDGSVIMYSRRKLLYPGFDYIKSELKPVLDQLWASGYEAYFDGELYKHGVALQDISGIARRSGEGDVLDYMIYDIFFTNHPQMLYAERKAHLDKIWAENEFIHCKCVPTYHVSSDAEISDLYDRFLIEGYEGAMLRMNAPYRYSLNEYHSNVLLKIKPTLDHEFEIVRWETGLKGKAADALMIVCKTPDGVEFPVTPAMEIAARVELAAKMPAEFEASYKGKFITIYFDEYSKNRVPQRARTKMEIRDMNY